MSVIMNKQRNELGRAHRKEYDGGLRNDWCKRSAMRSYSCRGDSKCGVVNTFVTDNLVLETYEATN